VETKTSRKEVGTWEAARKGVRIGVGLWRSGIRKSQKIKGGATTKQENSRLNEGLMVSGHQITLDEKKRDGGGD